MIHAAYSGTRKTGIRGVLGRTGRLTDAAAPSVTAEFYASTPARKVLNHVIMSVQALIARSEKYRHCHRMAGFEDNFLG